MLITCKVEKVFIYSLYVIQLSVHKLCDLDRTVGYSELVVDSSLVSYLKEKMKLYYLAGVLIGF